MIEKLLRPWPRRLFLNRISKWVILITLALSIMVVGVSIYAENVGNFIITIGGTERESLVFYQDYDPETGTGTATQTLHADAIEDLVPASYADIELYGEQGLLTYMGNHSDTLNKTYYAMSFVLGNTSSVPIDYNMYIDINASSKGSDPTRTVQPELIDDSLRVMVIRSTYNKTTRQWEAKADDNMNVDTSAYIDSKESDVEKEKARAEMAAMRQNLTGRLIYAKPDTYLSDAGVITEVVQPQHLDASKMRTFNEGIIPKPYTTLPFYSARRAVSQTEEQLGVAQVYKYTLVMWIEGEDKDNTDGIMNAQIRMTCTFEQASPGV